MSTSAGIGRTVRTGRWLVRAGTIASAAMAAHCAVNLAMVPRLRPTSQHVRERVSVLVPARDEAHRIEPTIRSLLAQEGIDELEIIVLDDGSSDGTAALVMSIADGDPRLRVIIGDDADPPPGWIGKPWACHRLSEAATGTALVFVDADVVLAPTAIASAVNLLRERELALVSPVPRQVAGTTVERLTQPLLNWAWISLLPMPLVTHTEQSTWAAAIGQFLVVDATAYRTAGGHALVRDQVVEDLTFAQEFKARGHAGTPVIGADLATCRMYESASEVYEGYAKSLWSLFPGLVPMAAAVSAAGIVFVLPGAAALLSRDPATRRWGAVGYAAAVANRVMTARAAGERTWPDALAHPASVTAMMSFVVASRVRLHEDTLRWKGRRVVAEK